MRLVTFEIAGQPRPGVLAGDGILDLGELAADLRGILAAGALDRVRSILGRKSSAPIPRQKARLLAPLCNPGMILSCGMNYYAHLKEMNTPVPDQPAAFTKSVASIIGPEAPIVLPPSHPDMVDWEGEFSVVIGKPCHRVRAPQALDYVAGYTIVNDVSARDWVAPIFSASGSMGPIHAWEQNLLGKMFPTFCPMGPALVTRDEVPDPNHLRLTTKLNGKTMQSANTDDLVFSVAQLIEYYSQFYRFLAGDVITTGSPSGVGYGRTPKVFMRAGDLIEVEVEHVGLLRNPVVS